MDKTYDISALKDDFFGVSFLGSDGEYLYYCFSAAMSHSLFIAFPVDGGEPVTVTDGGMGQA